MPKTAGLSFRAALEKHFGDGFRHDYQDYPLAQTAARRREQAAAWGETAKAADFAGVECVHGHFLAAKYLPLAESVPCTFITWLREPLARLVSHYRYWLRSYDSDPALVSPLHRRVVEEKWSLERFCLAPELRNVYTEFLWGFPPERLNFVGITEFYADDLRYFSQEILGNNLALHTLNQGPGEVNGGGETLPSVSGRRRIEACHAADISLYQHFLRQRKQRIEGKLQVSRKRV
jgi:hypothetical protein